MMDSWSWCSVSQCSDQGPEHRPHPNRSLGRNPFQLPVPHTPKSIYCLDFWRHRLFCLFWISCEWYHAVWMLMLASFFQLVCVLVCSLLVLIAVEYACCMNTPQCIPPFCCWWTRDPSPGRGRLSCVMPCGFSTHEFGACVRGAL